MVAWRGNGKCARFPCWPLVFCGPTHLNILLFGCFLLWCIHNNVEVAGTFDVTGGVNAEGTSQQLVVVLLDVLSTRSPLHNLVVVSHSSTLRQLYSILF